MDIILNKTSTTPLYEQIVNQIKSQIIEGVLGERTQLPSIRNLAKEIGVSVITTKRAFDELELQGFLKTSLGKGSIVAPRDMDVIREEYIKKIESHLRSISLLADFCGISEEEVAMMYQLQKRSVQ